MFTSAKSPLFARISVVLLLVSLSSTTGDAQRGGGPGPAGPIIAQPVGLPRFEYVGPSSAGRIAAAAAVAGKPGVYYAGAASGGVWKSADGGATWKPTFDQQTSQAIGALAVSPSNPNIVWAGTGEAWAVRDMDMMGDGIYKSTDAGETWTNMGLAETGRIGTVVVHPDQREHRAGLRARARDRPAEGARRVPHGGRRQDVAAGAVRQPEHRMLRPPDVVFRIRTS